MSDEFEYDELEVDDDAVLESALARKEFLLRAAGLTAAAAGLGSVAAEKAWAAAERASTLGAATNPAKIAVDAAKKHRGYEVKVTYEGGLQALDPKNFTGPLFDKLTGVKTKVIELPFPDLFSKAVAEHIARSGAFDVIDVAPVNLPGLVDGGVVEPLDSLIRQFGYTAAQKDVHPLYRALGTYKGKTYGIFDDGDVFALYYRKDIFGDRKLRAAYKAKFKRDLRPPKTWDEYTQTAQFITDQLAPKVYGAGAFRKQGSPGNQFAFFQQFRANGGQFFNASTMKATINSPAGVKTLQQMLAVNKASIPGVEQLDAVGQWTAWLQGKLAMIFSWPPTGRISENYSQRDKSFSFIPKSQIVGKVGYAIMPGKHGEHAAGFVKSVTSDSKNKEAAYLWLQWATSPEISLQRVTLPYALRDPYRLSHFRSKKYRSLWPGAAAYLSTLNDAANNAVLDLIMPGSFDYSNAIDRACSAVWGGKDPKSALDDAARDWDNITKRLGVDKQRAAYREFLKLPGSTAKNTIAARGQAVKI